MNDALQFVSFYLEDRLFGLDIRVVKEIYPQVKLTPVPRTPSQLRGLVNIRGQVVLVMDIAVIFGRECRPISDESHIIILKTAAELANVPGLDPSVVQEAYGERPIGFVIDRVGDVVNVSQSEVEPPPPHLAECNARFVKAVLDQGDRLQLILKVDEVLGASGG